VEVCGQCIDLCGVEDPDVYRIRCDKKADPRGYKRAKKEKLDVFGRQLEAVKAQTTGHFTVLLSHRPEEFDRYVACGFDLVLCGHAHGGQWRIPGVLNGLFAPDQGIFPRYAGGRYDRDGTTMIVSRGLARESTLVPRIFNPPELVIVTIK
jgi:predicted MPP superfamily phosphohydrolase